MSDRRFNSSIMQTAWNRLHKHNQNCVVGVFGGTGSGKSYTALRICQEIDPEFSMERVVFSARDFLHLLNHGNLKRGNAILWDEGGVGLGNRNWQSQNNKSVCEILQTFRIENLILIFSAPDFHFLDAGARRMFHMILETKYIDRIKKQTVLKPFDCTYDVRQSKMYFSYPIAIIRGAPVQVDTFRVGLPRKELVAAYEAKKRAFVTTLNLRLEKAFDEQDVVREKRKKPDFEALVSQVVGNPKAFLRAYNGRSSLASSLLCAKLDISESASRRVKAIAEQQLKEAGKL